MALARPVLSAASCTVRPLVDMSYYNGGTNYDDEGHEPGTEIDFDSEVPEDDDPNYGNDDDDDDNGYEPDDNEPYVDEDGNIH